MKDIDQQLIFEEYKKKRIRLDRIRYLTEDFGGGAHGFQSFSDDDSGDDSSDDDSSDDLDSDTSSDTSDDDSDSTSDDDSDSSSDSSDDDSDYTPPSTSSSSTPSEDGKLSEDELDDELEVLSSKKDKIQKLFDSESIDKEVAHAALDKLKSLTNNLVAKYI